MSNGAARPHNILVTAAYFLVYSQQLQTVIQPFPIQTIATRDTALSFYSIICQSISRSILLELFRACGFNNKLVTMWK